MCFGSIFSNKGLFILICNSRYHCYSYDLQHTGAVARLQCGSHFISSYLHVMGWLFLKYRYILDDGRRCQSCCSRAQLFGFGDSMSGWKGDCGMCNIRWYRGQLACVSRNTFVGNLWGAGEQATVLIFRFAGLDLKFFILRVSFERRASLLKGVLTSSRDSEHRYFGRAVAAGKYHPLTLLDVIGVKVRHCVVITATFTAAARRRIQQNAWSDDAYLTS